MDFGFDLQLFGGGETSSSTSREIPEQTENEKALENFLLDSASLGGNMAPYMYQAFAGSMDNTVSYRWHDLITELNDRKNDAWDDYYGRMTNNMDEYKNAVNGYSDSMRGALNEYKSSMGNALNAYNQAAAKRQPLWDDLVNGVLPSQYATNRQAALNADLKGTMGSAINNLASRGVINSGVGNKALDDISQSASDTLAKRYADDLQLEASLLGQDRANYRDRYDVAANTATGKYSTSADAYTNIMNQQGNMYNSLFNNLGQMYSGKIGSDQGMFDSAIAGQAASYEAPNQFLSYAGTLSTPVSNLYNTMYSGRMGTGSTTTTQDNGNGGMWSAIGGLGAAAIVCFTGDTLVTTPDGYKAIKDITVGDTVLSVCDGKVTPKKVKSVTTPHESLIVNVYFDNGTVWRTTPHQRYFDGKHFSYLGNRHIPAMVYNGEPSRVLKVEPTDKREIVYDFAVEGFTGENVYFANDVAAEGFGD